MFAAFPAPAGAALCTTRKIVAPIDYAGCFSFVSPAAEAPLESKSCKSPVADSSDFRKHVANLRRLKQCPGDLWGPGQRLIANQ
jgi:hypothetical protein